MQGPKGEPGTPGPEGPPGKPGSGSGGPGMKGEKGDDGKSVYIAVDEMGYPTNPNVREIPTLVRVLQRRWPIYM